MFYGDKMAPKVISDHIWCNQSLAFDLENVFPSTHSRDEYLQQVLLKCLH